MKLLNKYGIQLRGIEDGIYVFRNEDEYCRDRSIVADILNSDIKNKNYKIISLGSACFAHNTMKSYGLKMQEYEGELSHPFDRCTVKTKNISKILDDNFLQLCNPIHIINGEHKLYEMGFPHDIELFDDTKNNINFIISYLRKIANFYEDIYSGKYIFFINHNDCGSMEKLTEYSMDIISVLNKKFKQNIKYKFIMINTQLTEVPSCFDNIDNIYLYLPYPDTKFVWYLPECIQTDIGMEFAITTVEAVKDIILRNLK